MKKGLILAVGGIGVVLAGGFWYVSKAKQQTTFENAPVIKAAEVSEKPEATSEEGQQRETKTADTESINVPSESSEAQTDTEKKEISQDKTTDIELPKKFTIKNNLVSFGHESASGRKIDTIVLHSSYSPSGDPYSVSAVIALWKSYGVAPHYMVARDGTVYRLVADKDIAYHAGESEMKDGRQNVNDFSIGVEILNTKEDEYTEAQYQAVSDLIGYLKGNYAIKYVVGHDDIAPGRKTDPWNFKWNKL